MRTATLLFAVVAAAVVPVALTAQDVRPLEPPGFIEPRDQPSTFADFAGVLGQPVGGFHDNVNITGGGEFGIAHQFGRSKIFGFRAAAGMMLYGYESRQVPFNDNIGRVQLDLTTTNNIFNLEAGPTLIAPDAPVRPYADASVGLSYFFTQSKLQGTDQNDPFAETENYHAARLAWKSGAGLLIRIGHRQDGMLLDIGARYVRNGRTRYLTHGDVHDDGYGGYYVTPKESDANMVLYHIGLRVPVVTQP